MSETVNVTEADKAIEDRIYRERGRFPHGHLAARHRTEATRQAEADKAELVEALGNLIGQFRYSHGAKAKLYDYYNDACETYAKHGGKHDAA